MYGRAERVGEFRQVIMDSFLDGRKSVEERASLDGLSHISCASPRGSVICLAASPGLP